MPDFFTQRRPGVPLVDWRAWKAVTSGDQDSHPGMRCGLYYYLLAKVAQEKLGRACSVSPLRVVKKEAEG